MSTTYYDGTVVFRNGGYTDTTATFRVTTMTDAPTPIRSIVMPTSNTESYVIECRVVGYTIPGSDVFLSYTIMVNNDYGNISVYGGNAPVEYPMMLVRDGSAVMDECKVTSTVTGNTLSLNIIGLPLDTIKWAGTIRIHRSIHSE